MPTKNVVWGELMKTKKMSGRFLAALIIFSLTGQIAWVVENMYFNVFIYKMFGASAADISLMVAASAAAATLTTILMGALSDRIGKRKLFICGGYILWGFSIWSFAFIREDVISRLFPTAVSTAAVGVTLVIIMDCIMTFFGSSANDAAFNAWLTDSTDSTNRGAAEGINAMMPLVAILAVFGGFMAFDLDKAESWVSIYTIIGAVVLVIGVLGIFLIKEDGSELSSDSSKDSYIGGIIYGFRPSVIKKNSTLYIALAAFAVFGISIQIFMPYLILYYSVSLGLENYVFIMAPAIIIAAVVTVLWGRFYDKRGFTPSVSFALLMLMGGYVILYFFKEVSLVFIGSLLMMCGYLSASAAFGAVIRDFTPENKAGRFQGLRIVGQVLIPGIIGPAVGAFVLRNALTVKGDDGTESFIPNENIFAAALLVSLLVWIFIIILKGRTKKTTPPVLLLTREGEELTKSLSKDENAPVFDVYPRPMMKRDSYLSLNGKWDFGYSKSGKTPKPYEKKILVPFAPQSLLSGICEDIPNKSFLFYRREFALPEGFNKGRVLLNFGAVDRECTVFVNGKEVVSHKGGYFPFSADITDALKDNNIIEVSVFDAIDRLYPYGKQSLKRGGMWYTPVSGIWQSVWLESVPEKYITAIAAETEGNTVTFKVETSDTSASGEITVKTPGGEITVPFSKGVCSFDMEDPLYWSPEEPNLYDYFATVGEDCVESYFAFRTLEMKTEGKVPRLCLNGKPYFFHALLDQGYYSDGIFLPASPEGFEFDIKETKKLGFNTLRKHIKIEPQVFYSMCDRFGMAVFQDMVNNGSYSFLRDTALPTVGLKRLSDKKLNRDLETRSIFGSSMEETVKLLKCHPCICMWTVFNEGWGQFCGNEMYDKLKMIDETRFIDTASGWFKCQKSDVESEHVYFKKFKVPALSEKPLILSEFGGYSYKEKGHVYNVKDTYGYRFFTDSEKFEDALEKLYEDEIIPAVKKGLCASVYTQISDVEDETNGLFTYDRKVCKVNGQRMKVISQKLYEAVK